MKKKIKIAQVVGDSSMTGAPRHVILLSIELKKRGYDILVVAPPGRIIKELNQAGIANKQVKMGSPFDRKSDHKIREILKNYKPDIVHCHGTKGGWLGRLAARKLSKTKIVYTEHLWTPDYHLSNPVWEKFQLTGLKYMDKFTDKTIAVSNVVKDFLVKEKIVSKKKIIVIPNMIDPEFTAVQKYNKPASVPIIVGSVGSLNAQKGFFYLLDAFSLARKNDKKKNRKLQIIGSGPLEKSINKKIKKLKLKDNVTLVGRVDDLREKMRHFSIYIQYSRSESFGMATLEAMALGVPVIVSNRGALPEIVDSNVTGLVVKYGRPEELAKAIVKLSKNRSLSQKIGDRARDVVTHRYNCEKIANSIEKVYLNLLTKSSNK